MSKTVATAHQKFCAISAAFLLVCLAACTSTGPSQKSAGVSSAPASESAAQPAIANYACADGTTLTIRNVGTSIRLIGPNGMEEELPASPANQRSRYGEAHDAIVIEGREALVMRNGQSPTTCQR